MRCPGIPRRRHCGATGSSGLRTTDEMFRFVTRIGVAVPPAVATAAVVAFVGLEVSGRTPLSPDVPRNVAEAAATGAPSEVLRLLRSGDDPHRLWTVRDEIISPAVTQVTALEAAVWNRQSRVLWLFDREGVTMDDETRRYLACLASDIAAPEVVEYLSPGRLPHCVRGAALERVMQRFHRD